MNDDQITRQCQGIMLEMLVYFDSICTKNNIPYAMIGGTLIGALRHQGWIPWDMDIDVAVLETDLPRLKELLIETMPETMFYQDKKTDPYFNGSFPKLRNRHSNYFEWLDANPQYKHHNGLQLDIFPYRWIESIQKYEGAGALRHIAKDELFPLIRLPFEGHSFFGPHKSRELMERVYGSLELPPKDQQVAHEGRAHPFAPCTHPESRNYEIENKKKKFY